MESHMVECSFICNQYPKFIYLHLFTELFHKDFSSLLRTNTAVHTFVFTVWCFLKLCNIILWDIFRLCFIYRVDLLVERSNANVCKGFHPGQLWFVFLQWFNVMKWLRILWNVNFSAEFCKWYGCYQIYVPSLSNYAHQGAVYGEVRGNS